MCVYVCVYICAYIRIQKVSYDPIQATTADMKSNQMTWRRPPPPPLENFSSCGARRTHPKRGSKNNGKKKHRNGVKTMERP